MHNNKIEYFGKSFSGYEMPSTNFNNNGPDVKILLTLDTERYTSNFEIGGKLGQSLCSR